MMKKLTIGKKSEKTYTLFTRVVSFFVLISSFVWFNCQINSIGGVEIVAASDLISYESQNLDISAQVENRTKSKTKVITKTNKSYSIKKEVKFSQYSKTKVSTKENPIKAIPSSTDVTSDFSRNTQPIVVLVYNQSDELVNTIFSIAHVVADTLKYQVFSFCNNPYHINSSFSIRPPPMMLYC